MKKYCLLILVFVIACNTVSGEIKNGYMTEIDGARASLKNITALCLNNDLTASQKRKIKIKIEALVNFISCFELTESMLAQFRIISPELYEQVDGIRDINGRSTDVYIKFIPREQAKVMSAGITCVAQAENNKHTNISEYGEGTVSVKVWIFDKAFFALAHELGHVNYIVPNLARYFAYYRMTYLKNYPQSTCKGHNNNDISGKNAMLFEKEFNKDYQEYLRNEAYGIETPAMLFSGIRKKIQVGMTAGLHPTADLQGSEKDDFTRKFWMGSKNKNRLPFRFKRF